jgi:hypothetical protein
VWWIPVLVFFFAFLAGILAATRWLPEIDAGPVGGLAFFTVCGLIGAAVGLFGLHVYSIVREVEAASGDGPFGSKGDVLADGIISILYESGLIFAAAVIVFLLAPREQEALGGDVPARTP